MPFTSLQEFYRVSFKPGKVQSKPLSLDKMAMRIF